MKKHIIKALRWSERYTKTDMLFLAKGGFWLFSGRAFFIASGLILTVGLANLLSEEAYGTYQFIISYSAVFTALSFSGMNASVRRLVAQGFASTLREGYRTKVLWGIGVAVIGCCISAYYLVNENTTLALSFFLIGTLVPITEATRLGHAYLLGTDRYKESTTIAGVQRFVVIGTTLIAAFLTTNPVIIILVFFLSRAIMSYAQYSLIVHKYKIAKGEAHLTNVVHYGKHLTFINVATALGKNLDKILVFHFLGAVEVAIYALAMLPTQHLLKTFGLVGQVAFSKIAKKNYADLQKILPRKTAIMIVVAIATVLAFVLAAPYFYAILFPKYTDAVIYAQVAALALLIKPAAFESKVFIAHALKKQQYIISFTTTGLKLILLVILLPILGIWGAVVADVASRLYWSIVTSILFYAHKPAG